MYSYLVMSNKNSKKIKEGAKWIKKVNALESECTICLQSLQTNPDEDKLIQSGVIFRLVCKHEYHNGCFADWLEHNTSCPLCRQSVHDHDCISCWALQNDCIDYETFKKYTSVEYTGTKYENPQKKKKSIM